MHLEKTEVIPEEDADVSEHITKIQILSTNQNETSVILPDNCGFLTKFWCQMDDFTFKEIQHKGEKSDVCRISGSISAIIEQKTSNI